MPGEQGRPQVILTLGVQAAADTAAAEAAVDAFADRGFRSLWIARADGDGDWRLLGVLPLFDPPREDAASTIATAREMGVTVKMLTGDALAIAKEMATTVGLGAGILNAAGLGDVKKTESAARPATTGSGPRPGWSSRRPRARAARTAEPGPPPAP